MLCIHTVHFTAVTTVQYCTAVRRSPVRSVPATLERTSPLRVLGSSVGASLAPRRKITPRAHNLSYVHSYDTWYLLRVHVSSMGTGNRVNLSTWYTRMCVAFRYPPRLVNGLLAFMKLVLYEYVNLSRVQYSYADTENIPVRVLLLSVAAADPVECRTSHLRVLVAFTSCATTL